MIDIKQKIRNELKKSTFPDLKLLFSTEVINISLELLRELLEEEKQLFEKTLKTKDNDIIFDTFEDFSELDYFWSLLNHFKNVKESGILRDIVEEFRPKLQDFGNYVAYNKRYYDMLAYCDENTTLDEEQKRIMYLSLKSYKDRGINLPEEKQNRLKELNKILAELSELFGNNIIDDEKNFEYSIEDLELIKDLPEEVLQLTKTQAKEKGKTGYLFTADPSSYIAIMQYCSSSTIRKAFDKARNSFASSGKYDNRQIVLDILKFKKEKALILGYNSYAEMSLNDKMADSPEQVFKLIGNISEKAQIKSKQEIKEITSYFKVEEIEAYDFGYYSRIYKEEKYEVNEKELKKYFEYEETLKYLHNFVKDFYQLELKEINTPLYSDEVKAFEVYKSGKLISYYLLDPFYNKDKRGGAWADNLRDKFGEKIPLVVNVCNFQKTDITLLSIRDVETIFHEFGHAIHEMLSVSKYSDLSGFNVEWDFVELPSQLLENWVGERESLKVLAKHHKTGEYISDELLDKLDKLKTYMTGSFVVRQNSMSLLDMNLYAGDIPENIEELDKKALKLVNENSIWERGEDYKMYCSFGHIFGGGYSAGYYSYMWAEIIEADIFAEIKSQGMFEKKVGEKFLNTILGEGTKKPAKELFCDFMGREVKLDAFYERNGL